MRFRHGYIKIKGEEERILKKYRKGRILDSEDEKLVRKLASQGFINRGVSIERKMPTAKTTPNGISAVKGTLKV